MSRNATGFNEEPICSNRRGRDQNIRLKRKKFTEITEVAEQVVVSSFPVLSSLANPGEVHRGGRSRENCEEPSHGPSGVRLISPVLQGPKSSQDFCPPLGQTFKKESGILGELVGQETW